MDRKTFVFYNHRRQERYPLLPLVKNTVVSFTTGLILFLVSMSEAQRHVTHTKNSKFAQNV